MSFLLSLIDSVLFGWCAVLSPAHEERVQASRLKEGPPGHAARGAIWTRVTAASPLRAAALDERPTRPFLRFFLRQLLLSVSRKQCGGLVVWVDHGANKARATKRAPNVH